jgi:hypothetical protein
VDTPEDLCELIGTTAERRALEEALAATETAMPVLRQWVANHPLVAIASQDIWPRVLATLAWVVVHDTSQVYLRQLDVDGVDTKFVERNYKLLEQLLLVVAPERVDPAALGPARRLGFRDRPQYVRLRFLGRQPSWPPGISEARLRGEEIPAAGIAAATVFIVENEVSYLAFPDVPDSIVMFGSGYALEPANTGAWLEAKEIAYWGDIDTHGFSILSNLRQRYPKVVSVLMDTSTLLAHQGQWAHEPVPANRLLPHLTTVEAALYQDLVEDRYGHSVRLEQERIRFSMVNDALRHWVDRPRGRQPS